MTGAFSRRSFLASTALTVGMGCKREGSAPPPDGSVAAPAEPVKGLSAAAFTALEAAMARILPSDDDGAGAREAACAEYVKRQLADPDLASVTREMETLARVLDVAAKKAAKTTFSALTPEEQDDILRRVQSKQIGAPKGFDPRHAFQVLVTFTLEGFLSEPAHGGNKDQAGWKFAGFVPHAGHHHTLHQVKP